MMFLKLSLNGLLYTIVMAMACSTDENARIKWHNAMNYHRSNCLVPFHYNLKTSLLSKYWMSGESNVTISINCAIQSFTLYMSRYMKILTIELKSVNSGIIYTPKYSVNNRKEIVVLDFVEQLLPDNNLECGLYTLCVMFLNPNLILQYSKEIFQTWYTDEKGNEKLSVFATLLQSRRARLFFPCWDEPQLSATFNISVEHETIYKVLSNMPIRNYELIDANTMVTIFHKTPPMSANDVAIMMYNADILHQDLNSKETVVNTWCRSHLISHMKFAEYVAGNITMYLENHWKILKNVPKVNLVAIPNFGHNIWQTWGLVLYNEADIIYNEELHPAALKTVIMRSIAHDITFQWFGNLFDPLCQSYWWLNEGFTMFLETYIIDKAFLDSRLTELFLVQIQHESRHLNTYFAIKNSMQCTSTILKSNSNFPFPHIIGAVLWRMLESVIPYKAFWMGINAYYMTYTYSNSKTPDDLWNVIQTVIDELNLGAYDLTAKQMMDIWTVQEHCPVLNVTRDYSSGRVIISKEFQNKLDRKPYFIPVTYTMETNINFNRYFPNIYLSLTQYEPQMEIPFNFNDHWFIVNIQQTGYYRVNYDPENWLKIAHYLNSENYTNIHVLNRAQIIDDAFHLATQKKLNFSIFWELAKYLWREKDFVAWYPMIKVFENISNIFAFAKAPEDLFITLKEVLLKIGNLFEHIVDRTVYDQMVLVNDDLSKYLKQELAKWGCIIDNASCLRAADQHLQLYLTNPKIFKIWPGWEKWTYCNGLKRLNYTDEWSRDWFIAFNMSREKSDYKMLEFFGCSENPLIILHYLEFTLPTFEKNVIYSNENKTLAEKERFYALTANHFLSTLTRHAKNTAMLKILLHNLYYIINSRVSVIAAFCVMINNAYSEEQLEEINKYVRYYETYIIRISESKITTRLWEIEGQMKFFKTLFG